MSSFAPDPAIGDLLSFLPGAGGRRAFWQPVADRLADRWTPSLFPYPGGPDVAIDPEIETLDDLYDWFVARAPSRGSHVIAQSMGCVLAMRFAIEHAPRVQKLVLVATSGGTAKRFGKDWRLPPEDAPNTPPSIPMWFIADRTELDQQLSTILAPTLLIFGDQDPLAPPEMGEYLKSLIPNAKLEIIRGGTHTLAVDRADEVARLIAAHLE